MASSAQDRWTRRAVIIWGLPAICLLPVAISSGCKTPTYQAQPAVAAADPTTVQTGKMLVAPHTSPDVYYATPFAGLPSLQVPDHWGNCIVVTQTPTHFRVLNSSNSDQTIEWKASGPKAPPVQQAAIGLPRVQPPATVPAGAIQPVAASVPAPPPQYAPPPPAAAQSPGAGLPAEPVPVAAPR
jgi:hypothetical protein